MNIYTNHMDITDIREAWDAGEYTDKTYIPSKLKEDYIFDEDLSVKRNREMVTEHNARVDTMRKEASERQRDLYTKLTNDVVTYITDTYLINEAAARAIEGFVYREKHSFMCDYFSYIDEIAELVEKCIEAKD